MEFNTNTLANSFYGMSSLPHAFSVFGFKDLMDVLIVSICVYLILIFIKQTRSFFVFGSIIFLFGLDFIARTFNLGLTRQLFQPLLTFFVAIFVLVFQPEIRKFFKWFASGRRMKFSKVLVPDDNVQTIVRSSFEMAKKRIGGIIVIPGEYPLDDLLEGGFPLEGKISFPLILSIFDPTSPGHDGAVLVEGSVIKSFGLHLPLAKEFSEFARVGTRHRAAAGITERTDSIAIVISEERGEVSVSLAGKLSKMESPEDLANALHKFLKEAEPSELHNGFWHYFAKKNAGSKIASVGIAFFLWFVFSYQTGVINLEYEIPIEFRYVPTNLIIKESLPSSVKVTITGNNSDINSFEAKDLRVFVDAKDAKVGDMKIEITKDNIKIPPYLDLTSVSPEVVDVSFEESK
jgi:diadenylate cyclase